MHDINTTWCHGCTKIIRCQHCTLRCFSPLFSPIWFTFIIYETCLTNPQQRFQIMIGICQCRIVFLKTITTVPGNVNMSIEGNTSLNKPIFCKNKTKSKKKNTHKPNNTTKKEHAQKTEIWAPPNSSLTVLGRKIHPSCQVVETEKHICTSQLPVLKHSIFKYLTFMNTMRKEMRAWTKVKELTPWQKSNWNSKSSQV